MAHAQATAPGVCVWSTGKGRFTDHCCSGPARRSPLISKTVQARTFLNSDPPGEQAGICQELHAFLGYEGRGKNWRLNPPARWGPAGDLSGGSPGPAWL